MRKKINKPRELAIDRVMEMERCLKSITMKKERLEQEIVAATKDKKKFLVKELREKLKEMNNSIKAAKTAFDRQYEEYLRLTTPVVS